MARLLLRYGADPEVTCNDGLTPLVVARFDPPLYKELAVAAEKRKSRCGKCGKWVALTTPVPAGAADGGSGACGL